MMSYPNFGGNDKSIHHPDVRFIAKIAEQAGVDLRILVLQRHAKQILVSTTIHRHFGKLNHQAHVLADNAMVLHGQLSALDGSFFECVRTKSLGRARWDEVASFLLPGYSSKATLSSDMFGVIRPGADTADGMLDSPEDEAVVDLLETALARVESVCDKPIRFPGSD